MVASLHTHTYFGSQHTSSAHDCYVFVVACICDEEEPISFDTWYLIDLSIGKKAIGAKWVYKLKPKHDGSIDCYKARLVAKGYASKKGIYFYETFALTCHMTTMHNLCALTAHYGWNHVH